MEYAGVRLHKLVYFLSMLRYNSIIRGGCFNEKNICNHECNCDTNGRNYISKC